jgi:hypothetical protein
VFVTTHVLAGAALGLASGRPLLGLLAGPPGHLAMDRLPHWGGYEGGVSDPTFLRVAVVDGLVGLVAIGLVARATPQQARLPVLAGIAGAVLLDLDKPAQLFLGADPFPEPVQRVHKSVQRESPGWWPSDLAAAGLLAATLAAVLRRADRMAPAR